MVEGLREWSVDAWRLGLTLLEVVLGVDSSASPFGQGEKKTMVNKLLDTVYSIDTYLRGGPAQPCEIIKYSIKRCLAVQPGSRIPPSQLI
jgi:hypothetical protein